MAVSLLFVEINSAKNKYKSMKTLSSTSSQSVNVNICFGISLELLSPSVKPF